MNATFVRKPKSPRERLFALIEVSDQSGCWIWRGSAAAGGYGKVSVGGRLGRSMKAHRWAYELIVGPVPKGLDLDHLCRVRNCVNPMHLEPVTRKENLRRSPFTFKKHCPHGHVMSDDNLYEHRRVSGKLLRMCRTCKRAADRGDDRASAVCGS